MLVVFPSCKNEDNNNGINFSSLPTGTDHPLDTFTNNIDINLLYGEWLDTANYRYGVLGQDTIFTTDYKDAIYEFNDDSLQTFTINENEAVRLMITDGYWSFIEDERKLILNTDHSSDEISSHMKIHILNADNFYVTSVTKTSSYDLEISRIFLRQ